LAVEWQKMSKYFMDQANLFQYNGFDVVNARLGYRLKGAEVWLNIINVLDAYYAVNSSKSQFGYNYTPGEPRNFNLGISYDFGTLLKKTTK
jgi:outer membrane receptor protein involved in Fe transport